MNYLKSIVALLSAVLVASNTLLSRGSSNVSASDWQTLIDAALAPVLVWVVPNLEAKKPTPPPAQTS